MEPNQSLQPQKNALSVSSGISLTVSQQTLAVQIHLTALNAKSQPEPELISEFDRVFSQYDASALEWAFTAWRRQSQFFPPICEILKLLRDWKRGQEEQRAIRARLHEKFVLEEGRKQGQVPEFHEVLETMAKLCEQMTMPEAVKKLRDYEARSRQRARNIPLVAQHMTPDQRAARFDAERAEIERYEAIERQQDGIY